VAKTLKRSQPASRRLVLDASGQTEFFDKSVEQEALEAKPVECLGMTFPSEEARREYFLGKLREKLKDPDFRKIEGFPIGEDEDIVRMSDPPYYTACPNPFLGDFVRCHGRPYDPAEKYHREPFAVDTSVGKTDALYKAHGYHTKVPHLAIVPSILHYTKPGDLVLDGFCGSGMTGVAAQWCGAAPADYRHDLEAQWKAEGRSKPEWGARRAILNDLGPAATSIAAGYCLPQRRNDFIEVAARLLEDAEAKHKWMYAHSGIELHPMHFRRLVWSQIFFCPDCSAEIEFLAAASDNRTAKVRETFPCPACGRTLQKHELTDAFSVRPDPLTGSSVRALRFDPVFLAFESDKGLLSRTLKMEDRRLLSEVQKSPISSSVPITPFPFQTMWEAVRLEAKGLTHVHHLFFDRTLRVVGSLWEALQAEPDPRLRVFLRFWIDSHFQNLSVLNRYRPEVSFPYNPMAGAYYLGSLISEESPFVAYSNKLKRIAAVLVPRRGGVESSIVSTGSSSQLPLPSNSVDYVFTDPPFGDNYPYSELNFVAEAWNRVFSQADKEAVVDRTKRDRSSQKSMATYQLNLTRCFREYHRVLKPGRWITVVFSNSRNSIWRAIQEAIGVSGFVIADVRTLDKQQLSFKQVTSSAVKQDLVISAYKPTETVSKKFTLGASSQDAVWSLMAEHLANVPVFVATKDEGEVLRERTAQVLHDHMVAFHVQRELSIPLGTADFLGGLRSRFPERDGMFFLPTQVVEYDRKRSAVKKLKQIELSVNDEWSAIMWVRGSLAEAPKTFQELTPLFHRELQAWARHEKTVELKDILAQSFLCYDGRGPVPSQIHSYLSSNHREFRNLDKNDPKLKDKAVDRWYVPDPGKEADLEKVRDRALLREFESYRESKERKLKTFRTEAVRAGFKAAFQAKDYATIIAVAAKLPESVLQEDEKLLVYYDVAVTRTDQD